jgi:UrcA family protein
METVMKNLALVAAIAALSFLVPTAAATAEPGTQRTVVRTADLDLASAKGQRVLDLRILHAASSLCDTPSAVNPLGWKAFKYCRDTAMAVANTQRQTVFASKLGAVGSFASAK